MGRHPNIWRIINLVEIVKKYCRISVGDGFAYNVSLRAISGTSTVQLLSNIPLRENVCLGARLRVELSIVLLRRLFVFNSSWDLRYSRNFGISLRDLNSNGNGSFTPVH